MNKLILARAIMGEGQKLSAIMDSCKSVSQEYFDRGITFLDADVSSLGITASDVVAVVVLLENINKFFNGEVPAVSQYHVTANMARRSS